MSKCRFIGGVWDGSTRICMRGGNERMAIDVGVTHIDPTTLDVGMNESFTETYFLMGTDPEDDAHIYIVGPR